MCEDAGVPLATLWFTEVANGHGTTRRSAHCIYYTLSHNYSADALLALQSAILATAILAVTRWYPIQTNEDRIMRSSL